MKGQGWTLLSGVLHLEKKANIRARNVSFPLAGNRFVNYKVCKQAETFKVACL